MSSPTILWYFADPMCSWCWGFSAIIETIRSTYDDKINIALMLGGLRPGTTDLMTTRMRDEILHHWHEVQKMSGQSFTFENAMPEGFVYDTEPASRAVLTVAELDSSKIFSYFRSIQSAFYVDQVDVTQAENLAGLASLQGLQSEKFMEFFQSDILKQKTLQHFEGTRQAGVRGFPSMVIQRGTDFKFITKGYRPFDELKLLIEEWLKQHPVDNAEN